MLKCWTKRTDVYAKIFPILYLSYKGSLYLQHMQPTFLSLTPQVSQKDLNMRDRLRTGQGLGCEWLFKELHGFYKGGLATWAPFPLWGFTLLNYNNIYLSKSGVAEIHNGVKHLTPIYLPSFGSDFKQLPIHNSHFLLLFHNVHLISQ